MHALGMARDRIFLGYDVIDNACFRDSADVARRAAAARREEHNLPQHYFLASSRFVPQKNLHRLVGAYAMYRKQAGPEAWHLVLCGDGPLRGELEALVARRGLGDAVQFAGFVQYPQLPAYYGLASCFVHVSTVEQWGLVVNEAAASGLPVLVSNRCGCVPELVQDGRNGWVLDPLDAAGIAAAMQRISDAPEQAAQMGGASQDIVSAFGPRRFADGLASAVKRAAQPPAVIPGPLKQLLLQLMTWR